MIDKGSDPSHVMDDYKFEQIDDDKAIIKIVKQVIKDFPDQVAEYRAGKEPVLKFLVGQVMKASKGVANPEKTEQLLKKKY